MSIAEPIASGVTAEEKRVPQEDNLRHAVPEAADDRLLGRFVAERDDSAFALLVTRHGPLVMGVCRRALGNEQDAEDAFQATFLVLARKSSTVRQAKSLPAWLYQTAYRIALRARAGRARRREQPLEAETMIATGAFSHIASEHEQSVLDEELNRLPEKYRLPLFLCCVEGRPREEAAEQLGLSAGALKGRLERGRQLLRRRLLLRGVSLTVAIGVMVGLQQTAQAAQTIAPSLIASTVQAGVQYAAGQSVLGFVSQNVLSLANGSFQVMSLTTTKIAVCCLLLIGALAVVSNSIPAPAIAGAGEGETIVLTTPSAAATESETVVAFLADDEREGQRDSAEARGRRDGDGERRGPRDGEGERQGPRDGEREGNNALRGFRPQTQREAALYQMILQLQREMAAIRREMQTGRGTRDGEGGRRGPRDGESTTRGPRDGGQSSLSPRWQYTKEGKVFKAYDKNGDMVVTLDEWLIMRHVQPSETLRKQQQTTQFNEAEPSGDGRFTPAEFIYWYTKGRFENVREGGQRGPRDGESGQRGARDGEGGQRGPRDGEGPAKQGPRDG